jgi:hypothetical protein
VRELLGTTTPPRAEDLSPTTAVLYIQETVSYVVSPKPARIHTGKAIHPGKHNRRKSPNQTGHPEIVEKHQVVEYATWFTRLPEVSADMPISENLEREVIAVSECFYMYGGC